LIAPAPRPGRRRRSLGSPRIAIKPFHGTGMARCAPHLCQHIS